MDVSDRREREWRDSGKAKGELSVCRRGKADADGWSEVGV